MALVAASVCFAWAAAGGRTAYPRLAAALNPLVIYTVLTVAAYSIPMFDIVLGQTILGVMSVVFFSSWEPHRRAGASSAGPDGRVGTGLVSGADSAISLSLHRDV